MEAVFIVVVIVSRCVALKSASSDLQFVFYCGSIIVTQIKKTKISILIVFVGITENFLNFQSNCHVS